MNVTFRCLELAKAKWSGRLYEERGDIDGTAPEISHDNVGAFLESKFRGALWSGEFMKLPSRPR